MFACSGVDIISERGIKKIKLHRLVGGDWGKLENCMI